jgi:hypothetical protein
MPNSVLRRSLSLTLLYALLGLGWVECARRVGPPVIAAAYEQRSLPVLNGFFKEGRHKYPLEHYLDRWGVFVSAALLGGVLHLAFVLGIRHLGRRNESPSRSDVFLVLFAAAFLALTALVRRGDYIIFGRVWDAILRGGDPWSLVPGEDVPVNAYGPLYNALAVLAWINPLAPKLAFAFAYLVFVAWLIKDVGADQGLVALSGPVVVFWLLNPFPWMELTYWGHFDVLVALACVLASTPAGAARTSSPGSVWGPGSC